MAKNSNQNKKRVEKAEEDEDLMSIPEYMAKSSAIIADALQKGFDVLHLENGDIVTTGTKTIVTTYRWNSKNGKMVKFSVQESPGSQAISPIMNISAALKKSKKPSGKKG